MANLRTHSGNCQALALDRDALQFARTWDLCPEVGHHWFEKQHVSISISSM